MSEKRLKQAFKEAAEIARAVPKEFQNAAFGRALDVLLKDQEEEAKAAAAQAADAAAQLLHEAGSTERLLASSVEALNLAIGKLGIEGRTPEEISALLRERFGIGADSMIVSQVLAGSDKILDRVEGGSQALFGLLRAGMGLVGVGGAPPEEEPPAKTGARKGKGGKAASAKAGAKAKSESSGPAAILNDLVARGFFATARTTADVLTFLQRKGIEYSAREIYPVLGRLIQNGLLSRAKNAAGAYVYKARG